MIMHLSVPLSSSRERLLLFIVYSRLVDLFIVVRLKIQKVTLGNEKKLLSMKEFGSLDPANDPRLKPKKPKKPKADYFKKKLHVKPAAKTDLSYSIDSDDNKKPAAKTDLFGSSDSDDKKLPVKPASKTDNTWACRECTYRNIEGLHCAMCEESLPTHAQEERARQDEANVAMYVNHDDNSDSDNDNDNDDNESSLENTWTCGNAPIAISKDWNVQCVRKVDFTFLMM
jgi:hypothetical protein